MLSYIGVRKWVGNPLVAYDFVPGVIDGGGGAGVGLLIAFDINKQT
jgi:hypothetical protein